MYLYVFQKIKKLLKIIENFDLSIGFNKEENVFNCFLFKINSLTFLLLVIFCNNYLYTERAWCVCVCMCVYTQQSW